MVRIGVDIGGTKIRMGLFDRDGRVFHQQKISSHATLSQRSTPGEALAFSLRAFLTQADVPVNDIEAIAIGFPGIMNRQTGAIISCPNLPILNDVPLAAQVEDILQVATLLEKDVNLIGLGEHAKGRGCGVDNFACIFVGSGLGCALILGGELYQGADGLSGELGHIPIDPNGLPCTCGGIGCLEMYCSGKALTVRAAEILGRSIDPNEQSANPWALAQEVIENARQGGTLAVRALEDSFHYLGLGIVTLTNILNLRLVILGGGIVEGWSQGIDIVRAVVRERGRVGIRERLELDRPGLNELPYLVGANVLITNYLEKQ